jgi:hypothetical protein
MRLKVQFTGCMLGLLLCCGCSMMVAATGKRTDGLLKPGRSREAIHKDLGTPKHVVTFPNPRPASEIPQLVALARYRQELRMTSLVSGFEDYEWRGRIHAPENYAGYGMASGLTLGVSEIIFFPALVDEAKKDAQKTHRFRVWYSVDGTCFAHVWNGDDWSSEVHREKSH